MEYNNIKRAKGFGEAQALLSHFQDTAVSVILRDGDLTNCPYGAGDLSVLREFNGCAVVGRIKSVECKAYADLSDWEWCAAGYISGHEGRSLTESIEIDLSSPVCVINIEPKSLSVRSTAKDHGVQVNARTLK